MINAKKKGNKGENNFAQWLRLQNITRASRNPSSGGNIVKSDVVNDIDINFEVKTVKRLNLLDAFKQSTRDAEMSHNTPYVVVHFNGMPENEWLIVMNNHDWAELYKKAREPKIMQNVENSEQKWVIKQAIQNLKKILKYLEAKI